MTVEEQYAEVRRWAGMWYSGLRPRSRTVHSTGQRYTIRTNPDGSFSYEYL
jgi:hypothetical protein